MKPPRPSTATNGHAASSPKPTAKRTIAGRRTGTSHRAVRGRQGRHHQRAGNSKQSADGLAPQLDLINEVAQSAALVTQATGLPPERLLAPPRPEALPPSVDERPEPLPPVVGEPPALEVPRP